MGFSAKQKQALRAGLDSRHVRTREANGRELSYIEGWYAISQANRIFGFDGWNRETTEARCVLARENRGKFTAVYLARVRISVRANGVIIVREGHGTGEGRGESVGEVHDTAFKAAETDATKRALATFGNAFGLDLYGAARMQSAAQDHSAGPRRGGHPDDVTPIPRPSTFYGRGRYLASREPQQASSTSQTKTEAPLVPVESEQRIDKSTLALAEPKRLRDKRHLRFVASQPCLICGRQPSDPHHLQFAQPRALGLKVSDEFTVPLCRVHHRQLHQAGNEATWWGDLKVDALEIAKGFWEQSRSRRLTTGS